VTGAPQPTLEEVAALAGVSRATVSRVVNGSPRVSPAARDKVERAVAELGYVPNRAARSLVTKRADSVALVVSESETRFFSDPWFAVVARSVAVALSDTDMQLVLVVAQSDEQAAQRARLERFLLAGRVDGVVLVSLHGRDPLPRQLVAAGVPTVLVGRPVDDIEVAYVDADNAGGATAAVRHLLERGRTRIATVAGPQDMSAGRDRLAGYQSALRAAGLPVRPSLVAAADFSEEGGAEAMRALLAREPDLDAVFAASDLMATGALRALRAAGRLVPDDVAVVGFDDLPASQHTDPPLTTVRQALEDMGREAIRLLLATIAAQSPDPVVVLPTELVVRASS
jgi:DNA-binding LacI/PurR family transcriptional regulator